MRSLRLRATTTLGALFSGCLQPLRREGGLYLSPFPAPRACFLPHNKHQSKRKSSAPLPAKSKQRQDQLIFISSNESPTFFFEERDFPTLNMLNCCWNLRATTLPSNWGSPNNHPTGRWRDLSDIPPQPECVSERLLQESSSIYQDEVSGQHFKTEKPVIFNGRERIIFF